MPTASLHIAVFIMLYVVFIHAFRDNAHDLADEISGHLMFDVPRAAHAVRNGCDAVRGAERVLGVFSVKQIYAYDAVAGDGGLARRDRGQSGDPGGSGVAGDGVVVHCLSFRRQALMLELMTLTIASKFMVWMSLPSSKKRE